MLMMVAAASASAQAPTHLREKVWASPGGGEATALAATADGGLLVAGRSGSAPRVVMVDDELRLRQDMILPGSDALPTAIAASPGQSAGSGAYSVVAGPAKAEGHERGLAVWRLVPGEGGLLWQEWFRRFRRTALDGSAGAVGLDDGGLVATGWTGGRDRPMDGAWVLRLDSDGESAWRKLALPPVANGVFVAKAAARTERGDVLVAVYGAPAPGEKGGIWVLRFDLFGNDYSQKVIDEAEDERPAALVALADGGYAVAGSIAPADRPEALDAWVVRCDDKGDILWDHRWPGGSLNGVAVLPDGGLLVAGWRAGAGGRPTGFLARLEPGGKVVWEQRLGNGRLAALTVLADGAAAAAGAKGDDGRAQMWVVRFLY
jgi:outer membrane protein assembly factor BamB